MINRYAFVAITNVDGKSKVATGGSEFLAIQNLLSRFSRKPKEIRVIRILGDDSPRVKTLSDGEEDVNVRASAITQNYNQYTYKRGEGWAQSYTIAGRTIF